MEEKEQELFLPSASNVKDEMERKKLLYPEGQIFFRKKSLVFKRHRMEEEKMQKLLQCIMPQDYDTYRHSLTWNI